MIGSKKPEIHVFVFLQFAPPPHSPWFCLNLHISVLFGHLSLADPRFGKQTYHKTKQSLQVLHQLPGSSRDLLSMFRAPFSALYSLVLTALFEMSLSAVFSSLIRGGVWLKHSQTLQNTPKHSQTLLSSTYSLKKRYLVLHCSSI